MTRPRAADDFAVIRARLEELSGHRGGLGPINSARLTRFISACLGERAT
jgi:hypothetical protein